MTPRDQRSEAKVDGSLLTTSGAMYSSVPTKDPRGSSFSRSSLKLGSSVNSSFWFSMFSEQLGDFSRLLAELYLVSITEEKELNDEELALEDDIGDMLPSCLTSLAVPKSASTRCHWSLNKKFAGFRSLCMIALDFRKAIMLTICAV